MVGYIVLRTHRSIAKPFVIKYHYSEAFGKASIILGLYKIGESKLLGVITFGQVSGRLVAQSIFEGGTQYNTFEFLRMCVLDDCDCPRTYFMSKSISILRQHFPKIKCLVSFADQTEGHKGIVYQAGSWLYCGMTKPKYHYMKDGKRYNKRLIWDYSRKVKMGEVEYYKAHGYEKIIEKPKLRYIMPLRKVKLKQKILEYVK